MVADDVSARYIIGIVLSIYIHILHMYCTFSYINIHFRAGSLSLSLYLVFYLYYFNIFFDRDISIIDIWNTDENLNENCRSRRWKRHKWKLTGNYLSFCFLRLNFLCCLFLSLFPSVLHLLTLLDGCVCEKYPDFMYIYVYLLLPLRLLTDVF